MHARGASPLLSCPLLTARHPRLTLAQLDPGEVEAAAVGSAGLGELGRVQLARGEVAGLVGDKAEEADVGAVVGGVPAQGRVGRVLVGAGTGSLQQVVSPACFARATSAAVAEAQLCMPMWARQAGWRHNLHSHSALVRHGQAALHVTVRNGGRISQAGLPWSAAGSAHTPPACGWPPATNFSHP